MAYTLPANMLIHVQIAYKDAAGNPAVIDGEVDWTSSNDAICDVVADPADSTMATVSAMGPVGSAQISATADADLGEGLRPLTTLLDVTVVAGEAITGTINVVGDPEPIP